MLLRTCLCNSVTLKSMRCCHGQAQVRATQVNSPRQSCYEHHDDGGQLELLVIRPYDIITDCPRLPTTVYTCYLPIQRQLWYRQCSDYKHKFCSECACVQSSSPSYLLMASLDGARAHAQQAGVWKQPLAASHAIREGLRCLPDLPLLSADTGDVLFAVCLQDQDGMRCLILLML